MVLWSLTRFCKYWKIFLCSLHGNDLLIHWCWLTETWDASCSMTGCECMQAVHIWHHSSVVVVCTLSCGLCTANWGWTFLHTSWVSSKSCREKRGRREITERGVERRNHPILRLWARCCCFNPLVSALKCNRTECWSSSPRGMTRMKAFWEQ